MESIAKIESFDCKCNSRRKVDSQRAPLSCSRKLPSEVIYKSRLDFHAMTRETRDFAVMAVVHSLMRDSEQTVSTKKTNGKRQRTRVQDYLIKGIVVCRETFCFCLG